jgi:hypothetical protein
VDEIRSTQPPGQSVCEHGAPELLLDVPTPVLAEELPPPPPPPELLDVALDPVLPPLEAAVAEPPVPAVVSHPTQGP